MLRSRHLYGIPLAAALAVASCGGGSPTAPKEAPAYSVVVVVFYDENGNGALEPTENARVPDVEVEVAGRTARSDKLLGRAVVAGVPEGTHPVTVRASSLPPFYQAVPGVSITVQAPQPSGADANFPLTLPIGSNRPNVYMGFGDSITLGEGARTSDGYKDVLQDLLQKHFGRAVVVGEGLSGSKSDVGAVRIGGSLASVRPAYTLILYGTNDWNRIECRASFPCFTIDSLRSMVRSVRAVQGLAVLATIIPVNPAEAPPDRNEWVARMNDLIRPMAREEGAVLADLHAAFLKAGDLTQLFTDRLHPNDRGYQVIAAEYFRAITTPSATSASVHHGPPLLLAPLPSSSGAAEGLAPGRREGREPRRER